MTNKIKGGLYFAVIYLLIFGILFFLITYNSYSCTEMCGLFTNIIFNISIFPLSLLPFISGISNYTLNYENIISVIANAILFYFLGYYLTLKKQKINIT